MTEPGTRAIGAGDRLRPNAGSQVPMAHAIGREIIRAGLTDRTFIDGATSGFAEYEKLVEPWTLSLAVKVTGVPSAVIRELAHASARGEPWLVLGVRAQGTDELRALANLSLLTGRDHTDRGRRAPFHLVEHPPPVELTDERFPVRLTEGSRAGSSNGRVRKGGSTTSLRRTECVELSPEDAGRYGVVVGEEVRVVTRQGSTTAPVWVDPALPPGLAFMTVRPSEGKDANLPAARAGCPIVGAAEFRAAAIRIEKMSVVAIRN